MAVKLKKEKLIIENFPIILASTSPRRRQLLAEAGYKFEVVVSQIDESSFTAEGVAPVEYAKQLALAKATEVAKQFPDCLVIGADTGFSAGLTRSSRALLLFAKP